MADKIRWGILSTANIGRKRVVPAMLNCQYGVVAGVAIGVEALSPPEDSTVGRLADQMALSIRGIAETPPGELKLSPAAEKVLADRRAAQRRAATQAAALRAASQPSSQPTTTDSTRTADIVAPMPWTCSAVGR